MKTIVELFKVKVVEPIKITTAGRASFSRNPTA
jgi:hypothetical protein